MERRMDKTNQGAGPDDALREKAGILESILNGVSLLITYIDKEAKGFFSSILDVTEGRRAEAALQESEQRFRILTESFPTAVMLYQDNKWIYANSAAAEITGYSIRELLSMNFWDFVHPDDRHIVMERGRKRQSGEAVTPRYQFKIVCKDRMVKWVDLSGETITFNGKPAGIISVMDITDRKREEQEKEKLQAQLTQAQKMESVGRLAGGIAHDFNNMLAVILGRVDMGMMRVEPAQPLYKDLQEIRKAAERSASLTRQLLAFARKQTVSLKVLDLNETVEGMLKILRRLIGEDIEIAWLPGKNVAPIRMDPGQIDQILANLCVNAKDAIGGVGRITIETEITVLDENYCADHKGFIAGDYVTLSVSDNGCGMDKSTLDKLFEPFFTTKGVGQGTGLGLSTVYGIVKQHNGFINVYSEPGRGSTFKIYLPRHLEALAEPAGKESAAAVTGNETVLLVEDEPAILEMTGMMLHRLGYAVLSAGKPAEAIELARNHTGKIHLLITDVVMPEMNGRDLAQSIASLHPQIRRLFMSGYPADVIARQGVLDEGVLFIQKPFLMKDLAAKLREAIGNS